MKNCQIYDQKRLPFKQNCSEFITAFETKIFLVGTWRKQSRLCDTNSTKSSKTNEDRKLPDLSAKTHAAIRSYRISDVKTIRVMALQEIIFLPGNSRKQTREISSKVVIPSQTKQGRSFPDL